MFARAQAIPTITVGGTVFTDLDNLLFLTGQWNASTGVTGTLRSQFVSAGYQVPSGKTLYIRALQISLSKTAVDVTRIAVGYGDTDVGFFSAADPTNPVFPGNTFLGHGPAVVLSNVLEVSTALQIPALKYPFVKIGNPSIGSGIIIAYGYAK